METPPFARVRESRRLGTAVVDVDVNPARTCTFRCAYCDVADLRDGDEPDLDREALAAAVRAACAEAGPDAPVLVSGNGEPTTVLDLDRVLAAVIEAGGARPYVLATNGSRATKPKVRAALKALGEADGRAWLKLDAATRDGRAALLRDDTLLRQVRENLRVVCNSVPTWIQTTVFGVGGPPAAE